MNVFDLVFAPSMLLMPLVFVQFYPTGNEAKLDMQRVRSLRMRLWLWTSIALIAFFTSYFLHGAQRMGWWDALPWIFHLGAPAHKLMWTAFFPLWFVLAMPLLAASKPEMVSPFAKPGGQIRQARSASLVPRQEPASESKTGWYFLIGLWVLGAAATGLLIWKRHAVLQFENPRFVLSTTVSLACGLLPVLIYPMVKRALLSEPEPIDEHNSPELSEAYARLRAAKLKGHFVFSLVMLCLMLVVSIVGVGLRVDGSMQGILGAIVGSIVGIGGAAFGVLMSNRRMRIHRLLNELAES